MDVSLLITLSLGWDTCVGQTLGFPDIFDLNSSVYVDILTSRGGFECAVVFTSVFAASWVARQHCEGGSPRPGPHTWLSETGSAQTLWQNVSICCKLLHFVHLHAMRGIPDTFLAHSSAHTPHKGTADSEITPHKGPAQRNPNQLFR